MHMHAAAGQPPLIDVPYGPLPAHRLDLHFPPSPITGPPRPLVVFVHGGAWRSEDKADHAQLAARLALRTGCAVAVLNYRLTPRDPPEHGHDSNSNSELRHPTHAEDVLRALTFLVSSPNDSSADALTALHDTYDPTALFLIGHSCGAHILACLFLDSSTPTPSLTPPPALLASARAIALSEGIYDLDLLLGRFPSYRTWFLANAFGNLPDYAAFDASRYPLRADGAHIRWLVIHSPGDSLVDLAQAEKFYAHLQSALGPLEGDRVQRDWTTISADHNDMLRTEQYAHVVGDYFNGIELN
ncbi:hypothetical protein M0805_006050 [Coniferiporia weirii]|nr:hypothetical protein M0805_006050 [Coniferiporia weirii]